LTTLAIDQPTAASPPPQAAGEKEAVRPVASVISNASGRSANARSTADYVSIFIALDGTDGKLATKRRTCQSTS